MLAVNKISTGDVLKLAVFFLAALIVMFEPSIALAQSDQNLGDFAQSVRDDTLKPILDVGVFIAYLVGIGVVGVGINKFMKVSKGDPQSSPGEAVAYVFGGGALMALGFIADFAANSMADDPDGWQQRTSSAIEFLSAMVPYVA